MFDTKKESTIARTSVTCNKKTILTKKEIAGKINPSHLFSLRHRKICNSVNSAKGTNQNNSNIHNKTPLTITIPIFPLSLSDML